MKYYEVHLKINGKLLQLPHNASVRRTPCEFVCKESDLGSIEAMCRRHGISETQYEITELDDYDPQHNSKTKPHNKNDKVAKAVIQSDLDMNLTIKH